MLSIIKKFHKEEADVVTVDVVVLTIAVIGLAVAGYNGAMHTLDKQNKDTCEHSE